MFMIFMSNTNGIEGTFGALPALKLGHGNDILKRRAENAHGNCITHVPHQPQKHTPMRISIDASRRDIPPAVDWVSGLIGGLTLNNPSPKFVCDEVRTIFR
jgi:hypothetical protein